MSLYSDALSLIIWPTFKSSLTTGWAEASTCKFLQHEVQYLGHKVSDKGVATELEKVQTVAQSHNNEGGATILGVQDFAEKAKPLHKLTETTSDFKWTHECQTAFDTLKHLPRL